MMLISIPLRAGGNKRETEHLTKHNDINKYEWNVKQSPIERIFCYYFELFSKTYGFLML